jgi:hypothetical protein
MLSNTIVSYDSITKPFGGRDVLLQKTRQAAEKAIVNSTSVSARMTEFASGLDAMQQSQGNFSRVLHTPRNPTAALLQAHVASQAVQHDKLESLVLKGIEEVLEIFEVRFSQKDWVGWMISFFTWIEGIVPAERPPALQDPEKIANHCNIAVLGDWGTGLYGAPVCAVSVQNDPDPYHLLLHLGDVYYSGTPDEIEDRFISRWPQVPGALSRALIGNHERYTGAHGYFESLLPRLHQTSSYFALQNDFWLLIGLDTAFYQDFWGQEGVLDSDQVSWLGRILKTAGNRKVVLFSHHQPFTLLDKNSGGNLFELLSEFLETGKIVAWYWGHEHRCLLYDSHPQYKFSGRCVGHSGFPETRPDVTAAPASPEFGSQWRRLERKGEIPGAWVLDTPNLYIPGFEADFAPNGFMRLELRDDRLIEYVRAPDNANIYLKDLA